MSSQIRFLLITSLLLTIVFTHAQVGPFSPDDWPATIDPDSEVHYVTIGEPLDSPGPLWFDGDLSILSGGDQSTAALTIGGKEGIKASATYLNFADAFFEDWQDDEEIDILMQIYGDAAVLDENSLPRDFTFLLGTLPFEPAYLSFAVGGQIPEEGKNRQWNWVLFRIPNAIRPDGERFVGSISEIAEGATIAGGVNRGTIRMEGVTGLTIRVVAFGERGAFGEPEDINQFAAPESCAPEPATNRVWVDFQADTADHLRVISDANQPITMIEDIGPSGDKRRAVRPRSEHLNFGILDEHLGLACNDVRSMKVCVEFYDDPQLAGTVFGPESAATDDQGGRSDFPEARRHTLTGSGEWIRRAWTLSSVSLAGVDTGELTGGPRFISSGGAVAVSRVELGIFRIGDHPLAGFDPLPDCFEDPQICTDAYGNYADWNVATDEQLGLGPGSSQSDQEMILEESGPESDRRMSVRAAFDDGTPGFPHSYGNYAIQDEVFGPTGQDNALLAICVTYYDDPELEGASFYPAVYKTDRGGTIGFEFFPESVSVNLSGSGEWRDAYFEIPNIKFEGVNQGPQAAARFQFTDKVTFSRIRYGVIRQCGPNAGVNPLEECKPLPVDLHLSIKQISPNVIQLSWPSGPQPVRLESIAEIGASNWLEVEGAILSTDGLDLIEVKLTATQFFRLRGQ